MRVLIGVTGSIAAGKSLLCRRLAGHHGAAHLDADQEIHRMYEAGTPAFGRIVEAFGTEVIGADGAIDRRVLGAKVFGDPARMQALRTAIGDLPAHFMDLLTRWKADPATPEVGVFEAVNLFDNEYMTVCDVGWLVVAGPETAMRRLQEDRGHPEEEAARRLAAAKPWQSQAPLADRIFHNDGTRADFETSVDEALQELLAASQAGPLPPPAWRARR